MKKIESPPKSNDFWDFLNILPPSYYEDAARNDTLKFCILDLYTKEEYLYWTDIKYRIPKNILEQHSKEEVWFHLKMLRKSKATNIQFGKYQFYYDPIGLGKQLSFFDRNFGGRMDNEIGFEENKKIYLQDSILEESITSSQIEGAVTTRLKAREMLEKQQTPRNKSEQMIANNYATIRHIYEHQVEDLSSEKLLEIHRLITAKTLDKKEEEGEFRQNDEIRIVDSIDGEVAHTPPSFTEIPEFIDELCTFFNSNDDVTFVHPIIKASIIHFMIGYFHPFNDGNGRTARALFYWYLLKNGYSLTEYLSISKVILASRTQYYKSFLYVENDENDLTYFIHYQLKALKKAYNDLISFIHKKQKEQKELLNYQKEAGINMRQAEILQWFSQNPNLMLTAKEVENRMQVSNQTARTDIAGLLNLGYIKEISINKKEKRFIKNERFS